MKAAALQFACLALLAAISTLANATEYATSFDGTESPLSEGGAWSKVGLNWTEVRTNGDIAYGTHKATGYDDSYAHLTGFSADQSAEGTIFKSGTFAGHQEIELHLRWADSADSARGYEILIEANNRYAYIVRWNGPLGNYTILTASGAVRLPRAPITGDALKAQIVGSLITVFFNGVQVGSVSDSTWTTGNPGIGFYSDDASGEQNARFGFTAFTARDDSTRTPPKPPTNVGVQ